MPAFVQVMAWHRSSHCMNQYFCQFLKSIDKLLAIEIFLQVIWSMKQLTCVTEWHRSVSLQWHHNEHNDISNHWQCDCLLNLCSGSNQRKHQSSTLVAFMRGIRGIHWWTVNFPAQRDSNENSFSIWWCHHVLDYWLFVRGISRLLVDSPHKRAVMQSSDTCFVFTLHKLFNKKSICQ